MFKNNSKRFELHSHASVKKEGKKETQCASFICLSSRSMAYPRSVNVGNLSFEETILNLDMLMKYSVISILVQG